MLCVSAKTTNDAGSYLRRIRWIKFTRNGSEQEAAMTVKPKNLAVAMTVKNGSGRGRYLGAALLLVSLAGCVYVPEPPPAGPAPGAYYAAPGCCYAYPEYPPYYYGWPTVGFMYGGGFRGGGGYHGHWR